MHDFCYSRSEAWKPVKEKHQTTRGTGWSVNRAADIGIGEQRPRSVEVVLGELWRSAPVRPARFAAASPARVRSRMRARSNCFGLSFRGGFRPLRGAVRLVLVGFAAIGYLSQLVWVTSFRESGIERDTFERRFREFRGEFSPDARVSQKGWFFEGGDL